MLVVDNETYAYVADGAQVRAGGNVVITAGDDTDVDVVAIGAGIGVGAAGIGAGVGVTVLTKDTRAWIGDAVVDAKGNSAEIVIRDLHDGTTLRLLDGSLSDLGGFGRAADGTDARGVAVVAQSREDVLAIAIAGAGGLGAGIAGAVTVSVLDSDTRAYIDDGAHVNTGTGANPNQDVHVQAVNDVAILAVSGAAAGGIAGLAGGVDVGVIHNDTSAFIAGEVHAQRDIRVTALADREIDSFAISVGAGGVGLGAAVTVYSIGGNLVATYEYDDDGTMQSKDSLKDDSTDDPNTDEDESTEKDTDVIASVDVLIQGNGQSDDDTDGASDGLGQIAEPGDDPDGNAAGTTHNSGDVQDAAKSAQTAFNGATPNAGLSGATSAQGETSVGSQSVPRGTSAFIARNADVTAGRDVDLDARERVELMMVGGGLGVGGVGLGAGIAVMTLDEQVTAFVGAGADISAGGSFTIDAALDADPSVLAVTAGFGAIAGVAAAVVVITDKSQVRAYLEDGASATNGVEVLKADAVRLTASRTTDVEALTVGIGAGGFFGFGAAVVVVKIEGTTEATVGKWSQIGAATGTPTVGDVELDASATATVGPFGDATTMSVALAASFAGAVSAGVVSVTIGEESGAPFVLAEIRDGADVHASGAVDVKAKSMLTPDVHAAGGSLAFAAIGAVFAYVTVWADTRAAVGDDVLIDAGSLTVDASNTTAATAKLFVIAIGIVSGGGARADTTVDADVVALVGRAPLAGAGTTEIRTTDRVKVLATSSQSAIATADGGGGGAVTVNYLIAYAEVLSDTSAFVGDGTTIPTAGGVEVGATVVGAPASATVTVGSGGALDIAGTEATAKSTPKVLAAIGDAVTIGKFTDPVVPLGIGGDVLVNAIGRAEADATGNAYGGGVVTIGSPSADAVVDPDVDAHIGTDDAARSTQIATSGSIRVRAELTREGAVTPVDTISLVDVTNETLTFFYPGIGTGDAVMYSAPTGAAGGLHNGTVYTVLDAGANAIRLGSLFEITGIDPLLETITFAGNHPFQSGDCVYYDPQDNTSILAAWQSAQAGGTCANTTPDPDDRVFFVRVLDQNTIKLTTTFLAATADDAPFDVTVSDSSHLQFSSLPTGLVVNTALIYRAPVLVGPPSGGVGFASGVVGFTSGVMDVTLATVTLPDGTVVTAPAFGACPGPTCGLTTHADGENNIFVGLEAFAALASGHAVRYVNRTGTPSGLTSGNTYYVIKRSDGLIQLADSYCHAVGTVGDSACTDPDGPDEGDARDPIAVTALPLSIFRASGGGGTVTSGATTFSAASANFQATDEGKLIRIAGAVYRIASRTNATTITLDRAYEGASSGSAAWQVYSDSDEHSLERSIGGLVDGRTYYVTSVAGNTIQLSETRGGPAITTLDGSHRPGPHGLGFVQVDLEPGSAEGPQALFVNLTSTGSGTQRILAPSGQSLSAISPPVGDGISSASAQGGRGGIGEFTFPDASLTGSPSVAATLAANRLDAGADIELLAISSFDVSSYADTTGGGAISVGKAVSSTDLERSPTSATVASSTPLTAGGDVLILALGNHKLGSTARSVGGGAFAGKVAFTQAEVDNDVNVSIASDASIRARGAIGINADSQTTASTSSETYTVALGAGADSDNTNGSTRGVRIGSSGDKAERGVTIEGGVQIDGRTVDLLAQVSLLDLDAKAHATAYSPIFFGVASAFADAYIDIYSDVFVKVENGDTRTTITGLRGVDAEARHTGPLSVTRNVDVLAVALIFPQEGHLRGTDSLTDVVNADDGVLVVVGARTDDPGTSVIVNVTTNKLAATGHGLENGDRVYVLASTVPGGLSPATPYYIVGAAANDFQLSQTYGGAAIDLTSAGSAVRVVLDRLARNFSGLELSLYGSAHTGIVDRPEHRDGITYDDDTEVRSGRILWDADVIVLGGLEGSPLLVIDADGKVVDARAIKVLNSAGLPVTPVVGLPVPLDPSGGITVADIANSGYADIALEADDDIANEDYTSAKGNANLPWPTFEFRDTLAEVVIVDYSGLQLKIQKIDVVNDLAGADPLVLLIPKSKAAFSGQTTASGSSLSRASGKWGDDGFAVGDVVTLTGGVNAGVYRVTSRHRHHARASRRSPARPQCSSRRPRRSRSGGRRRAASRRTRRSSSTSSTLRRRASSTSRSAATAMSR